MTGFASARRVREVQDHVRQNLHADLGLEALAELAGVSRFHFARIFKAHAGETLNRFVRRARLERAAALMRARPERRLLEVALDAGFDSAADFSRVFRQHYGIAPRSWDRTQRLEAMVPGYEDGLSAARASCPRLAPVVRRHPACRLAYVRVATPFLDAELLEAGYRTLLGWLAARGLDGTLVPLLGMSWDQPETAPLEQIRFDLALPIPDGLRVEGPVSELRLPEIRSVEVRVDGELPHVALAWEHLYEAWLPASGEAPADLPAMKRFRRRPEDLGWFRVDLDCCIALD
ncbi:MAG: AraC family transcriptional regulator [Myxococcota bacterium]